MKKIKLGLFGGRRGNALLNYCKISDDAEVVAVCDKDDDVMAQLKADYGDHVRYYKNFEDFIKDKDIEAVVLANYATEHAVYAIKCMRAGKNVLSEVLPCRCLKEAVELVECVEQTKKIYAYSENYCYMPAPREMRKLYREGKLGDFEYGEGEYIHNCEYIWPSITYGEKDHWRNFMYANFYCTHSIGPLIHITGLRPVQVNGFELPYSSRCARMGKRSGSAGIEMITLENGAIIKSIHGSLDKDSVWYAVYGSKGRAESRRALSDPYDGITGITVNIDDFEGVEKNQPVTYEVEDSEELKKQSVHGSSDYYVMKEFINACKGKKNAEIIDVYEALDMFLPGIFAYFSVFEGGKALDIPDMRKKADRDKYRNDVRCVDKKVAGKDLLPSYSKCELKVPDGVYDEIRKKYLESIKQEKK